MGNPTDWFEILEGGAELEKILAERVKQAREAVEAILALQTNPGVSFRTRVTSLTKLIELGRKYKRYTANG